MAGQCIKLAAGEICGQLLVHRMFQKCSVSVEKNLFSRAIIFGQAGREILRRSGNTG
jgi:hypothetical protein